MKTLETLDAGDYIKQKDSSAVYFRKIYVVLGGVGNERVYVTSRRLPDLKDIRPGDTLDLITAAGLRKLEYEYYSSISAEPVKMTVAEIAEKLGHEVEIVKD